MAKADPIVDKRTDARKPQEDEESIMKWFSKMSSSSSGSGEDGAFAIPLGWLSKAFDFLGSPGTKNALGSIGSILGTFTGMGSSKSAGKSADKAAELQYQAAMADLAFRQKMYDEAQAKYGPLEQQLLGQAKSDRPLGYDMLSGQIQQQYADALRNLSAMGYQGGGLAGGAGRQAQFGLATALPQAYSQGQMNRLNLGTSLLGRSPVYGLGQNVSGGYQNLGNLYGNQFDVYNRLGMMGSAATGQALQGFGYGMGQSQGMQSNYGLQGYGQQGGLGSSYPGSNIDYSNPNYYNTGWTPPKS